MYRVLVVDDEMYEREGIKKLLFGIEHGISVIDLAENGSAALEKFEKDPYDIVVSDVKMPIMDGITMAIQMQNVSPDVKLLFLSGYDDFEYVKKAIQLHAYDYLSKPADNELKEKVQEMINDLDKQYRMQQQHLVMQDEYFWQQKILGIEFLEYLLNNQWNSIQRIMRNLNYLEYKNLTLIYGYQNEDFEYNEKSLMQRIKDYLMPVSISNLIGLFEKEMLLVIPSDQEQSQEEVTVLIEKIRAADEFNGNEWKFFQGRFQILERFEDDIQKWRNEELTPFIKNREKDSRYSVLVKNIVKIMQEHYMEDLSIKKIADDLYYSPNYLSAIFKREFGQGFYDYLVSLRMNKAKEMLLNQNMKIYQVAEAVGYDDSIAFIKRFKREFGCTPAQFCTNASKEKSL